MENIGSPSTTTESIFIRLVSSIFCRYNVPFLRPRIISGDASTDYEFIKHMLDWILDKAKYDTRFERKRPPPGFNRDINNLALKF